MDELLIAAANITIKWAGPWIVPAPEQAAPTAPAPPPMPYLMADPVPLLAIVLSLAVTASVMAALVWYFSRRRAR